MPPSSDSVLVYFTHEYSSPEQASLLDQLNQPNREFTQPYDLPDWLEPSDEVDLVGKSIDEIVDLHKAWVERNGINPNTRTNGSMFIVVDEGTPSLAPHRVQVVYLVDGTAKYEAIRTAISQAVGVVTTIDGGQQGWDYFMDMARPHGGVLPGEERAEAESAGIGAGGTG